MAWLALFSYKNTQYYPLPVEPLGNAQMAPGVAEREIPRPNSIAHLEIALTGVRFWWEPHLHAERKFLPMEKECRAASPHPKKCLGVSSQSIRFCRVASSFSACRSWGSQRHRAALLNSPCRGTKVVRQHMHQRILIKADSFSVGITLGPLTHQHSRLTQGRATQRIQVGASALPLL